MNWEKLSSIEEVENIAEKSSTRAQVIFKHSTRCGISSLALARFKSSLPEVDYHLLDLIAHRNVSNFIAEKFNVYHQSPQILLIVDGKCIFDISHMGITSKIVEQELNQYVK